MSSSSLLISFSFATDEQEQCNDTESKLNGKVDNANVDEKLHTMRQKPKRRIFKPTIVKRNRKIGASVLGNANSNNNSNLLVNADANNPINADVSNLVANINNRSRSSSRSAKRIRVAYEPPLLRDDRLKPIDYRRMSTSGKSNTFTTIKCYLHSGSRVNIAVLRACRDCFIRPNQSRTYDSLVVLSEKDDE